MFKKAASGVLLARTPQRTHHVRLGVLASCGLAGRAFLNILPHLGENVIRWIMMNFFKNFEFFNSLVE
jgi:hypothetical protein